MFNIFETQTVESLAKIANTGEVKAICEQGDVKGETALNPIQSWFFEEQFENPHHWNQAVLFQSGRSISKAVLEKAIDYHHKTT